VGYGYGYYLKENDIDQITKELSSLSSKGITDLFLDSVSNIEKVGKFISLAKKVNIRVHIWISVENQLKSQNKNQNYYKQIISRAKYYASLKDIAGFLFGDLNHEKEEDKQKKGGINLFNQFVKQVVLELRTINKNFFISASINPKKTTGKHITFLSQYFDIIIPKIYKENDIKDIEWITKVTSDCVSNSKKAKIWVGLQSYINEKNPVKLSLSEITDNAKAVFNAQGKGVIIFKWGLSENVNFSGSSFPHNYITVKPYRPPHIVRKPVIYLYPENPMDISVQVNLKESKFSTVYPKFNKENTWNVHAKPNGDITILDKTYPYLFWEAESYISQNMNKGFIVKSEDAENFLEEKLKILGLNDKESTDFITYWLPLLLRNKLSLCSFQTQEFFNNFELNVTPKPDSVIRVFLSIKKLDHLINIEEQKLEPFERKGFTVVEWGGSDVNEKIKDVTY
jgi:hypothetical protein